MHHSFDIAIAKRYGVNVAIFLNNIAFWTHKNIASKKHFYDGLYWTYNSIESYKELFPYWSTDQIRHTIQKCIDEKLIVKGNHNKAQYDRTSWYAMTHLALSLADIPIWEKSQMESGKIPNQFGKNPEPIPDINTDINTDTKTSCPSVDERDAKEESFNQFWEAYPRKESKKDALKAWKKIKQNDYEKIISDIAIRKNHNWNGKEKQYIPLPASYLNQERWNDELTINQEQSNGKRETSAEKCWRISQESLRNDLERERTRAGNDPIKLDHDPISALSRNMA